MAGRIEYSETCQLQHGESAPLGFGRLLQKLPAYQFVRGAGKRETDAKKRASKRFNAQEWLKHRAPNAAFSKGTCPGAFAHVDARGRVSFTESREKPLVREERAQGGSGVASKVR